jgi:uncharacterized protein (TIGR02145 family)
MLSPRLTNCPECANIPSLLKKIDCKLAELGNNLYNNISYMLNKPVPSSDILQLIGYRRILMHKYCNPNYVHKYSVQMIASRVIRLTAGCVSKCNELERCLEEPCDIKIVPNPTTTSTSTLAPITTTTSTSSSSTSTTSTSTTAVPTTTTTSSTSTSTTSTTTSSSTSTTTSTSSSTTTTTTTDPFFYYSANQYKCPDCNTVIGTNVAIKTITPLSIGDFVPHILSGELYIFQVVSVISPEYMATLVDAGGASSTCVCPATTTTTSSSSTTTTTTTCNVSSVHPYNYQLIAGTQGAFSSPNFIGSFTEACASQACLTAGTCFEYLGFATRFDASPAEIGMVSYLEPTGCVERPLDDGYYIFNYGGTNFVIGQIIDNTIVDFPICPTTTTTSTSSSTTTTTTTLPPTTTTTTTTIAPSTTTTTTTTVPLVTICSQIWTLENLDVETYRNGDVIPQVTDPIAWENLTTGAWCYYNNDSANGPIYGKLYNWYAVTDPRGLAPIGYHVPTDAEFETLIVTCLGGETIAGGKMKSTGTTLWNSPNTDATNSSGFTGLPAGSRNYDGQFLSINDSAAWWTSTPNVPPGNPLTARSKYVVSNFGFAYNLNTTKTTGLSVRLIKD